MKRLLLPLVGLVLAATGYSLHAGWLKPAAAPPAAEVRANVSDPLASDAAFRHRHCQPNHWRAVFLQQ